jgi:hypothetical protein
MAPLYDVDNKMDVFESKGSVGEIRVNGPAVAFLVIAIAFYITATIIASCFLNEYKKRRPAGLNTPNYARKKNDDKPQIVKQHDYPGIESMRRTLGHNEPTNSS